MINIKKLSTKFYYYLRSKSLKESFSQKEDYFVAMTKQKLTKMTFLLCRAEFISYTKEVFNFLESLKEEKSNDYYVDVINRAFVIMTIRHLRTLNDNKVFSKLNVEYNDKV